MEPYHRDIMSLKCNISTVKQSFEKEGSGNLLFALQESNYNELLPIHNAYSENRAITEINLLKLDGCGNQISTTSLATDLIIYSGDQYITDTTKIYSPGVGIFQIEFKNGFNNYTTEPFKQNTIVSDKIFISMDMSTPSTAGLNLTFASGSINMDWGDGSSLVPFVSGVELLKTYTIPNSYIAEILGDQESITQFIADNSKITQLANLKTGLLTTLLLQNNLLTGILDLSLVPVSQVFSAKENSNLEGVSFATSRNQIIHNLQLFDCNITDALDVSTVPIGGTTSFFYVHLNPLMTNVLFAPSGNLAVSAFRLDRCGLVGVLDLSNVPINPTIAFYIYSNPLLTGITFSSSGNGLLFNVRLYSCDLDYVDFTSFNFDANNCLVLLQNNSMDVADVNHILVDFYALVPGEGIGGDYTGRSINIGGTNDSPDGSSGGYDGLTAKTNLESKGFTVTI